MPLSYILVEKKVTHAQNHFNMKVCFWTQKDVQPKFDNNHFRSKVLQSEHTQCEQKKETKSHLTNSNFAVDYLPHVACK